MVAAQSTNPHSDRVNPFLEPKGNRRWDGWEKKKKKACFLTQEDHDCINPSPEGEELTMNTA